MEAYTSHVILLMFNLSKQPYSSLYGKIAYNDTCYNPIHYLPSQPLVQYDLDHAHYNLRWGIGTQMMVVNDAHFVLYKFRSLYNGRP